MNLKKLKKGCNKLTPSQWSKLPKKNPLKSVCRPIRTARGPTVRWDINYARLFRKKLVK